MERIKALNWYQKSILILMTVMALVFAGIYAATISRVGFAYKDAILMPSQENGSTLYSGKIRGAQAIFTVSPDKTVAFRYGDQTYGPYTAKDDPTAIPKDDEMADSMTGVELRCGEEILFRGGMMKHGNTLWLYNEDGTIENLGIRITAEASNGIMVDANGNVIDPMEPSAITILDLMAGPELTHKGAWSAWFWGVFICILTAITILFADELFLWNLSFQIRDIDKVEPSDWEIASRYIGWTAFPFSAFIIFIMGLQ